MRIIGAVALLVAFTTTVHGQASLGTVKLPQQVMADGVTLPAGTYELRLSGSGDSATIEFVQNGEVRARTMAIVPPDPGKLPAGAHAMRVRNDDDAYVRISVNRGQQRYLVYLPAGR